MSRSSHVQNGGNRLQKIETTVTAGKEKKMCQCGLSCREVCYRKEFNELVDKLAGRENPTIDGSSMAITVSTSGHTTVHSGDHLAIRKRRDNHDGKRSTSDMADSTSSGSRSSSTTSGIRNQSDNSLTPELPRVIEAIAKYVPSFQEKDLLDIHCRKYGSPNTQS